MSEPIRHTITTPVPHKNSDGSVAKESNRINILTGYEKEAAEAAAKKTQWHAKGHGNDAYLEMFCPVCSLQMTIENPSLNAKVFHCGRMERCPDRKYEELCILRDNNGRPRIPPKAPRVRWF